MFASGLERFVPSFVAGLFVAGCHSVEVIETPLPETPESRALLVATERRHELGVEVKVEAFDLVSSPAPAFAQDGLATDDELHLYAVFYEEPLSVLELAPGPVETRASFCFDLTSIGERAPIASFERAVGPAEIGRLGPLMTFSERMLEARVLPGAPGCDSFQASSEIEALPLEAQSDASCAARLSDGRVLVGTQASAQNYAGTFWLAERTSAGTRIEPVPILDPEGRTFSPGLGLEPTWTCVQTPSGTILLSDFRNPWLWEAELRDDAGGPKLVVTSSRANGAGEVGRYKWIAKSEPSEPDEIFALSTEGNFERWTPEGAERLHAFGRLTGLFNHAGLLRVGPGEAYAGFNLSGEVAHQANGRLSFETVAEGVGLSSLGRHPDGRIFAGDTNGVLYVRAPDGSWQRERDVGEGSPLTAIVPWRQGLLLFGTNGFGARLVTAESGALRYYKCSQALTHSVRVHAMLGDDSLLLTGVVPPRAAKPYVEILRAKAGPETLAHCATD